MVLHAPQCVDLHGDECVLIKRKLRGCLQHPYAFVLEACGAVGQSNDGADGLGALWSSMLENMAPMDLRGGPAERST